MPKILKKLFVFVIIFFCSLHAADIARANSLISTQYVGDHMDGSPVYLIQMNLTSFPAGTVSTLSYQTVSGGAFTTCAGDGTYIGEPVGGDPAVQHVTPFGNFESTGGTITLRCKLPHDVLELSVVDTGNAFNFGNFSLPPGGGAPPPGGPGGPPPGGPGGTGVLDPIEANTAIQRFAFSAQRLLIAVGVVVSVFLLPYIGVLFASGNPENIQKATEWLTSWATGLLLLLMSGIIIRIIGSDILGL